METAQLLRLAEQGIGEEFPPERFESFAESCRERGRSQGRARFFVLAEALDLIADAWAPNEAFWTDARNALNATLATDLPAILQESDEEAATSLASSFREAVAVTLGGYRPL